MDNPSPMKERLVELCEAMNITPNQFSLDIGKSRDFVRKIAGEIGSDALRNIIRIFPDINISWIITGEGNMLLQKSEKTIQSGDASLLLNILNKEIAKKEKIEEENKKLLKEKEDLKDYVNKLNLEILSLKNKLEIETSPKSKVV